MDFEHQPDKATARDTPGHILPYRVYLFVWIALVVLLASTIAVARTHFTSFSVVINLLISTAKAGLVLLFFMHLRYEGRFLKVMLAMAFAALTLIIILTFSDVWFRGK
jgi:cytochrome c oxidase subunit 4